MLSCRGRLSHLLLQQACRGQIVLHRLQFVVGRNLVLFVESITRHVNHYRKRATLAQFTLNIHSAFVDFRQSAHQCQSYAPSVAVGVESTFRLIVASEYLLLLLLDNSDAGVSHLHLEEKVGRVGFLHYLGSYGDCSARRRELHGVRHQVAQYVVEIGRREPAVLSVVDAADDEFLPLRRHHFLEVRRCRCDKLHGVALLYVEGEVVRLYLVERHEFVYQVFHLLSVAQCQVERVACLLVEFCRLDGLQRSHDKSQWRLQFVRHHGEEVRLHLVHFLHLFLLHAHESHFRLFLQSHVVEGESSPCHCAEQEEIENPGNV